MSGELAPAVVILAVFGAGDWNSLALARSYRLTEFGPLDTDLGSMGIAVNARGDVAGSLYGGPKFAARSNAALYRAGSATDLGNLLNYPHDEAQDLNDLGQVVGMSSNSPRGPWHTRECEKSGAGVESRLGFDAARATLTLSPFQCHAVAPRVWRRSDFDSVIVLELNHAADKPESAMFWPDSCDFLPLAYVSKRFVSRQSSL